jgi:rhodanese-related sulfurtransferase
MKYMKLSAVLAVMMLGMASAAALAQDAAGAPSGQARRAPASKAHVLSREELDKLLAEPDKVLLIDVRRPDEISSIGGFPVYLSIQINNLKNSLAWIPHDRILVTISNHAARAGRAADILTNAGFNVAGAAGAQTYEKAGGTLTKIVAPPPRKPGSGGGQEQRGE